jgi:3-oxoadipate enol-lactonase
MQTFNASTPEGKVLMKARCGQVDLYYTVQGQGPWITLSHSLACDHTMWHDQLAALTPHFNVLCFDTRGHGQSDAPAGPYTLEALADDAYQLMQQLGIRQTHWLGLSLGGMIGQTFALKYPTMVSSLTLAATTSRGLPAAPAMWAERARTARAQGMPALLEGTLARWFTAPSREARLPVIDRIAQSILSTPAEGYAACCEAIAGLDLTDRLHELNCPAHVIVGTEDQGTPPEMSRIIHEHIRGSQLTLIPQAAHLVNAEQPVAFNQALMDFLLRVK